MEEKFPSKKILLITGEVEKKTRQNMIKQFAPKANTTEDEPMPEEQADILISTEVLSEGQNLQDCNYVINYDLPWNPMRIVQRIGRIDRLTSSYDMVHSRECFPDKGLDELLKLVGRLIEKIETIDDTIGLDTGILGEGANPKQFNGSTANQIRAFAGNGDVKNTAEKLEHESDLMPAISPLNEINQYVKKTGIDQMLKIPMGRRSGKKGHENTVIVAYIQENPKRRFHAVLFDYKTRKATVIDDIDAFKIVVCTEDTDKHLPMDDEDYGKSFEQLLFIDKIARDAIRQRMVNDTQTINQMRSENTQYRRSIDRIMGLITGSAGILSDEEGSEIFSIIESPDMRAWESNVSNILKDYDDDHDVANLVESIRQIGNKMGMHEKEKNIKDDNTKEGDLTLVGAMFITGGTDDRDWSRLDA